ncbi:MAG: pyruvate:ferredoxin (flavodoxin) oxidoreductase [Ignavibacteriales bacterium CG12_big_fil_rev_8_21_14_0_65_30_8]|nr:MAG: pyruvate:ferredoxin (flavodoxin) oxidoreductase [Ignavibacteriales bacterium CG12_big_fil_rev_8_21_14_0_65_30_8]
MERKKVTIDGNEAAAYTAYHINEVIAIYPITPSSNMGEWTDAWSANGMKNIWNDVPSVTEMQSEGGASGAVHGALQNGALTTTFTSSQGLLLMIPNMFKIAGELTSTVFNIAARSIAAQALSIFGDHSDVMAARSTGFAMLSSNSVQEIMDMALIAQASTLESRIPFIHFFDGFRSSHEVKKIEQLSLDDMREMIDDELVLAHRGRAMSPDNPFIRGTAQNPDVFFQARETVNPFYIKCPEIVQKQMDKFAKIVGRKYHLFDYVGAPDAERITIIMGSGAEAVEETVEYLTSQQEKVGMLKVRLYRPFSIEHFINALPKTVKTITVLDRTKEPGANGEPMYLDVVNAITERFMEGNLPFEFPKIIGGRYGLSSKEFTPAMIKGIYDEMKKEKPKNHFTIGIMDDVTNTSLDYNPEFSIEPEETFRGKFYGLGADGTVGANKNSIKIIGEGTDYFAQGYFVYDSKKSGSTTISHLRFGPKEIKSTYLIDRANFIACHQTVFIEKFDMLEDAIEGATFLLNTQVPKEKVWDSLPHKVQSDLIKKKMNLYIIDAYKVAQATGMGARINTIMQTCFFAISNIFKKEKAIELIKSSIKKTYGSKGDKIVEMNFAAVDQTIENLFKVDIPEKVTNKAVDTNTVSENAPEFVRKVTARMIEGKGDSLKVSQMPNDGTYMTGTTKWEKRNIALEVPVWDPDVCIQCNKCVIVCPHATIRAKVYTEDQLKDAPKDFKYMKFKAKDYGEDLLYSLQVAVEDCTGCKICVDVCPAKNKSETRLKAINMHEQLPLRETERKNWDFFLSIPELDRTKVNMTKVKDSQFLEPLFEFSGACSGCGETPYVKLVSQMFGDRTLVANATGCSSIYGGNLPTTPWSANKDGRGPSWNNSLFEDNAEFGLGFRLAIDKHIEHAETLLKTYSNELGSELIENILNNKQKNEADIYEQRGYVDILNKKLKDLLGSASGQKNKDINQLISLSNYLVKKSVWIMGGDGWAYDIGYGGLDHVLASGKNVNVLVLDTEVYSNTGGQMSKATPRAAVAKFAAAGKPGAKKDLGMMAMSYGNVYVAKVALGANDTQTVRAFIEAEAYDGPSLIIAYSHCIAHGINMGLAMHNQKAAVDSGYWQLYRYNPELVKENKNPFKLESKGLKIPFKDFAYMETRYKMLTKSHPERAKQLMIEAQNDVNEKWNMYQQMNSFKPLTEEKSEEKEEVKK